MYATKEIIGIMLQEFFIGSNTGSHQFGNTIFLLSLLPVSDLPADRKWQHGDRLLPVYAGRYLMNDVETPPVLKN
jgi:hypothetical protein